MRRKTAYFSMLSGLLLLAPCVEVQAASAVSVPREARETAAAAIAEADAVVEREQATKYRQEAILQKKEAAADLQQAEIGVSAARDKVKQAETTIVEREQTASAASVKAEAAKRQAAAQQVAAEQASAMAVQAEETAQAVEAEIWAAAAENERRQQERERLATVSNAVEAASLPADTFNDNDELLRQEHEWKQKEKELKASRKAAVPAPAAVMDDLPEDWSRADAAYAQAARLNQQAVETDRRAVIAMQAADEKIADAEQAAYAVEEAKQELADARLGLQDAEAYVKNARQYKEMTEKALAELIALQDHPPAYRFLAEETRLYSFENGYQLVSPITYGYWQPDKSYSLSTRYISSRDSLHDGQASGIVDTTLSLGRHHEKKNYAVDYSLDVNLPTGKSALSGKERYAMLHEDVVENSQLGKSWQYTPGIDWSWKHGQENTWTIGTRYTISSAYDPSSDVLNDSISPGNEWRQFVRWRHAGRAWQLVGEVGHTVTGDTRGANGSSYSAPEQWEYKLTYNRRLPQKQNVMFYYWRNTQNSNPLLADTVRVGVTHYWGAVWSRAIDEKRTWRIGLDGMKTAGSRYTGVYNYYDNDGNAQYSSVYVAGRTKFTLGIGYDVLLPKGSSLSFDVQTFMMKDGVSTSGQGATTYRGYNLFVKYVKPI